VDSEQHQVEICKNRVELKQGEKLQLQRVPEESDDKAELVEPAD